MKERCPIVPRREFLKATGMCTAAWTLAKAPFHVFGADPGKDKPEGDSPSSELLWYAQPGQEGKWPAEGLPIGNGRLGAMLFGGVERERIQFNVDSLWTGDENPDGQYEKAGPGKQGVFGEYVAFGNVYLDLGKGTFTGYRRELLLDEALFRVTYEHNGVTYLREAFASRPDQVIVARLSANKPGACTGVVTLADARPNQSKIKAGNDIVFSGALVNGLRYAAQLRAIAQGGAVIANADGNLSFQNCDSLLLLLAADTDYAMDSAAGWRGSDPTPRVEGQIAAATRRTYDDLRQRQRTDHRRLFSRVKLDLGPNPAETESLDTAERLKRYGKNPDDRGLERTLFQYGRYLLVSSSRPGALPANLQGLWNDSLTPPWHCDYHSNINLQMNYWLAEPTNLAECHEPLFNLIVASAPVARKATRTSFGDVRGWTMRTSHNIFGGQGWQWNIPASAWYAQHFWEHYAFTLDKEFLAKTAYPLLKEVCQFWFDHLKEMPDGSLVVPNGWSPEHGPREDGPAHDQQIVWDLFQHTIEATKALGADAEFRHEVEARQARLVGPKIGSWGQLMEWRVERPNLEKSNHRHTSHLFAVYPGTQISVTRTPDLAKAAMVSLEARGSGGDSRRSWTWPWRGAIWARLRRGDRCREMIEGLLIHNTLPNLFTTHPPFQIDGNLGITAAIAEMLVQSHAGEVELLPALPLSWKNGSFQGLRARGAFTLEAAWADGKLTSARIHSEKGGPLAVRYGERTWQHDTQPGLVVEIRP